MLKEFKEFAMRSNVVDLAVGIIIGAAFSTIVKSQVDDIIMPPFGVLTGGVDFSNMFISLNGSHYDSLAQARQAAAPTLNFGLFINNVISFLIVAFVLFVAVKATNLRRKQEEEPQSEPPPSREVQLLEESGTPWLNPDGRAFRTPAPSLAGLARERIFARPAGEGLGMPNTSELANISTVSHISEQRCLFFVLIGSK